MHRNPFQALVAQAAPISLIRAFLSRLASAGIDESMPRIVRKRLWLTNVIALCLGSTTLPYLVIYSIQGQWWPGFGINVLFLGLNLVVLALNRWHLFNLSRAYILTMLNVMILGGAYIFGQVSQGHWAYLITFLLPLLLMSREEKLSTRAFMFTAFAQFLAVELNWRGWFTGTTPIEKHALGSSLEAGFVFLIVGWIVHYLQTVNANHERRLEELLNQVSKQQDLLIQSSKMSALGEMAGQVAHEINNPMSVIQLRSTHIRRLLQKHPDAQGPAASSLDAIDETIQRISQIINGLKRFAREGSDDDVQSENLQKLIQDALLLCEARFLRNAVNFSVAPMPPNLSIECRGVQISQVLLNLLINAFDAAKERPSSWIRVEVADLGESAQISVLDSGTGVPVEWREKIFQPFFSGKSAGMGTGLGLSISRSIVEAHSGKLEFDASSPVTRFVVTLPKKYRSLAKPPLKTVEGRRAHLGKTVS